MKFNQMKYIIKIIILTQLIISCHNINEKPVDLVYPYLDCANSRWFFFNSASRPFGMVNLSPDTEIDGAWGSGYRYHTDTVKGFSHIHAWQLSGVSVMPVSANYPTEKIKNDFYSKFSHKDEVVSAGYHKLKLERYNITCELTSTLRVGFHRYTFKKDANSKILINLGGKLGPSEIIFGEINLHDDNTLLGKVLNGPTRRRPKSTPVFFAIRLNKTIKSVDGWVNKDVFRDIKLISGEGAGAIINIDDYTSNELLMKVSISYVSAEQALLNMETELNHWGFDKVVDDSREEWNQYLSRIKVEGGTEQDRRRFYTDLWHALQGRRTISDVNGKYSDFTGDERKIKQIELDKNGKPKHRHFNFDAFWGAQWTLNTLWHLVYPEISEEFINSMLLYYKDGGLIPRGPSGGNYTYVMTGASTTPFIVSAYQKGIRGFNISLAYKGLKKNHMPGGIMCKAGYEHDTYFGGGLSHYIDNGFVPWPIPEGNFGDHQDGSGLTLEYAYQDWTLAQFAKVLWYKKDYEYFMARSINYKNVYDSISGWMRPKDINGKWKNPFDPYEYEEGFNESNSVQATWFVPHDLEGLAKLMGGKEKAVEKLNHSFEEAKKLNFTSGTSHAREKHPEYRRIPINYGNQPSIQTAFIFNKLNRPDLTQYWSRKVVEAAYSGLSPETGYNGDEDQGLMGSLNVLMKIGLFQLNGGTEENPEYQIGSPIFDKVTIKLNTDYYKGDHFIIKAINNNATNIYVNEVKLDNKKIQGFTIRHEDIVKGGKLILKMANKY